MNTARRIRIGLVVSTEHVYTRGILRGILDYAAGKKDWVVSGGVDTAHASTVFRQWKPDGVIIWTLEQRPLGRRVPTVAVLDPYGKAPRIALDNHSVGQMAWRHFRERGFRNLAFYGFGPDNWWSEERLNGFEQALADSHMPGLTFSRLTEGVHRPHRWHAAGSGLIEWLRELPKPVGVLAASDYRGFEVVDGCRVAGLRVPEDVAVLGVDDDELVCRMAMPPLSSLVFPWERIGQQAALMLDSLLGGKHVPDKQLIRIPVERVDVRESTDALAVPDPAVCRAYRFIRSAMPNPVKVDDVARHAGVSRRILEMRYQKHLRRSIHADMVAVRLERAMELLRQTSLSIADISARCGFISPEYMAKVFTREMKTSPRAYRRASSVQSAR